MKVRWSRAIVALALAAMSLVATVARAAFTFTAPKGWRSLTPATAASAAPSEWSPELAAAVASGNVAFVAVDPSAADPTFAANMNVALRPGTVTDVRASDLDGAEQAMRAELARALPDATLTMRSREIVSVAGARSLRFVYELTGKDGTTGHVAYYLPGDDGLAIVTYSVAANRLPIMMSTFEASVSATTGLAKPRFGPTVPARTWTQIVTTAAMRACLLAGGIWLARRWLRERRARRG